LDVLLLFVGHDPQHVVGQCWRQGSAILINWQAAIAFPDCSIKDFWSSRSFLALGWGRKLLAMRVRSAYPGQLTGGRGLAR
jgi:hypothetical protein